MSEWPQGGGPLAQDAVALLQELGQVCGGRADELI